MRQFAGFGTAEETNARLRYPPEHGQRGLSTAFDMPTLMGYDSDHPCSLGEVGREGVVGMNLVTSDHGLVETSLLLTHGLGRDAGERCWEAIRYGAASLEPVTAADLEVGFAIGEQLPDQASSIVDRTSFAVMQRLGVLGAATFDPRFAVHRFGSGRGRAFAVIGRGGETVATGAAARQLSRPRGRLSCRRALPLRPSPA